MLPKVKATSLSTIQSVLQDFPEEFIKSSKNEVYCNLRSCTVSVIVIVTRPLPRDGGMAEELGAPEARKLPMASTRGRRETENRRRASGANRM